MNEYMDFLSLLDDFEKFTEKRAMQTDFEGEHEWDSAEFRESKRDARDEIKKNYAALLERAEKAEALVDKFADAGTELYHRVKAVWAADARARVDWKELMRTYKKDWVI